ncbi:Xaa-Pro peptidase family protein [Metallumcola ferriviriculae]|uniref:Xaa-Pro peptidase family protein n=1 Tax=Metallumcola ferriviriculae TaxID=3039180 RepID=A0AAU0UMR1_9FIRM|nr:Xaa-Pro peptidase family protein [Desulfitibacteraceae bacterium MK1]
MTKTSRNQIKKFQQAIEEQGIDLALFTDRENIIYFTGLTELACVAVIIPAKSEPIAVTLWLDAPYLKEKGAIENVQGYRFPSSNLGEKVVQVIQGLKIKKPTIGFGKYFVEFSVFDALRTGLTDAQLVSVSETVYKLRAIKDEKEIASIQQAGDILATGMEAAVASVKEGVKEVEILAEAEYVMRKAGSEGSNFRMQVLTGERQLLTHPYAQNKTIEGNQTVVIHLGATYKGYCAKMCRTVALGDVPSETYHIYQTLQKAQQAAIESLKPPVAVKDVYDAAYQVIEAGGYGQYFIDDIGHGIGIRQSEFYPIIGRTRNHIIQAGMVVDLMLATIYHKEFGGPRVTDVVSVTADGPRLMTDFRRDMITVG